jgi:hypothetical protein
MAADSRSIGTATATTTAVRRWRMVRPRCARPGSASFTGSPLAGVPVSMTLTFINPATPSTSVLDSTSGARASSHAITQTKRNLPANCLAGAVWAKPASAALRPVSWHGAWSRRRARRSSFPTRPQRTGVGGAPSPALIDSSEIQATRAFARPAVRTAKSSNADLIQNIYSIKALLPVTTFMRARRFQTSPGPQLQ